MIWPRAACTPTGFLTCFTVRFAVGVQIRESRHQVRVQTALGRARGRGVDGAAVDQAPFAHVQRLRWVYSPRVKHDVIVIRYITFCTCRSFFRKLFDDRRRRLCVGQRGRTGKQRGQVRDFRFETTRGRALLDCVPPTAIDCTSGSFVFIRKIDPDQPHGTVSEYQGFIGDEAVKPRSKGRKKKFMWKLTGYSECTKTCGGGIVLTSLYVFLNFTFILIKCTLRFCSVIMHGNNLYLHTCSIWWKKKNRFNKNINT